MFLQGLMRDGRDGYVHYGYQLIRGGDRLLVTVKVEHEADRILLNAVAREKLRQPGINTWSYVLQFLNNQIASGWKPQADSSVVLATSDAKYLVGEDKQVSEIRQNAGVYRG